jgi:hypothetical protein
MEGQDPSRCLVKENTLSLHGLHPVCAGRHAHCSCDFSLDSFFDWQVDDIREDDEAAAEALEAAKKQEISKKQEKGGKAA